jgi:PKD repeat protein
MPDINYNFDKGYNNLSQIDVPLKTLNFTLENTLTAYADFGSIIVTPDFFNADPTVSDNNYFIDFGDGTRSTDLTASHTYKYPGRYRLTLVVADSGNNIFKSSDEKIIEVSNLIPDNIFLNFSTTTDVEQFFSSLSVNPIIVTRYNSVSMSELLSANNFKIDLSVEGNRIPLTTENQYNNDKNFHLKGNSFFANTRGKDFKVIDSVETNSVNIFAGLSGSEIVLESGEPNDVANTFVGTSGFGSFYYYEDTLEYDEDSQIDETFNSTVNPIFTNPY